MVLAAVLGACLPLLPVTVPMPFWEQPDWWPVALKTAVFARWRASRYHA